MKILPKTVEIFSWILYYSKVKTSFIPREEGLSLRQEGEGRPSL